MEQIILNLVPGGVSPVCYVSQYDVGRKIRLHLRNGSDPYVLSGAETINATIRKVSGEELIYDIANTSASYVDLIVNYDATDVIGESVCELIITESGTRLGSANFKMRVDPDVYSGDQKLEVVTASSPNSLLSFETNIDENLLELKTTLEPIQDLHGEDKPYPAGGGVNIWDEEWEQGAYDENGEKTGWTNAIRSKGYIDVTPSSTIYAHLGTTARFFYYWYASDKQFISRGAINSSGVITVPNNAYFMTFGTNNDYGTTYHNDISINNPSTDHDYHPYENICPIEGYTEANITRCGVNLLEDDFSKWVVVGNYAKLTSISPENVELIATFEDNDTSVDVSGCYFGFVTTDYVGVDSPSDYHWLLNNGSLDSNMTNKSSKNVGVLYNSLFIYPKNETTYNKIFSRYKIQIQLGNTASEYTPYTGNTYTIAFGQTVYGGVLDVTRGKLHVTWRSDDMGSLSWINYGNTPDYDRYISTSLDSLAKTNANVLCSALNNVWNTVNSTWIGGGNGRLSATSPVGAYSNANAFKTAVTGYKLAYELTTPFDIDLTPVQISALVGDNNILSNTNGGTEVKFFRMISAS